MYNFPVSIFYLIHFVRFSKFQKGGGVSRSPRLLVGCFLAAVTQRVQQNKIGETTLSDFGSELDGYAGQNIIIQFCRHTHKSFEPDFIVFPTHLF